LSIVVEIEEMENKKRADKNDGNREILLPEEEHYAGCVTKAYRSKLKRLNARRVMTDERRRKKERPRTHGEDAYL
jgi:hypothetical protein